LSLSLDFFEDACGEAAISFCNGRVEAAGVALGVASGCTLAAKARSPVKAGGGAPGDGGLEVALTASPPPSRGTAGRPESGSASVAAL
jgi:hypothetical protein